MAVNDGAGKKILGFYSVAPASAAYDRTPLLIQRGLARHEVPVFRLARPAVDGQFRELSSRVTKPC